MKNLLKGKNTRYLYDLFPKAESFHTGFSMLPISLYKYIYTSKLFQNTESKWKSLEESYYFESKIKNSSTIIKFLENEKYSVILDIPDEILEGFKKSKVELNLVTPKFIRKVLKEQRKITRDQLTCLLEFMLQDEDYNDFEGVYCLHLTNGELEKVKNNSKYFLYLPSSLEREIFNSSSKVIDNFGALENYYERIQFKGNNQLKKMEFKDFSKLLVDEIIQKEQIGKKEIQNSKKIPEEILSKIFERISLNLDQKDLISVPCVLTTRNTLCSLDQIFFKQHGLCNELEKIFEAFGIRFINKSFPDSKLILSKEDLFKKFLELSNQRFDSSIFKGHEKNFFNYLNDQLIKHQISKENREVISSFPIFETIDGSFKSLKDIYYVDQIDINLLSGNENFLKPPEKFNSELYSVNNISILEAITQHIFPFLKKKNPEDIGVKMNIIFSKYFKTYKNENTFISGLQSISFVPCGNLTKNDTIIYQQPQKCIDKSNEYLKKIYSGKSYFPKNTGSFKPESYLEELKILGMKKDISYDCIPSIINKKMDYENCKNILELLDNEELLSKDYEDWKKEFEKVCDISWIPNNNKQLKSIKETKPQELEDLLGGKYPICFKKINSNSLMNIFGWSRTPSLNENFKDELINNFKYFVEKNEKPQSIEKIFEEFEILIENKMIKDPNVIFNYPCIFVHSGFFKIEHFSKENPILKVPKYLESLIKKKYIMIPNNHSPKEFLALYQYTSDTKMDFDDKLKILNSIMKRIEKEKEVLNELKNIKLPTSMKKIKPQNEIFYSDIEEKFEVLHQEFKPFINLFELKKVDDHLRREKSAQKLKLKSDEVKNQFPLLKTILDLADFNNTTSIDLILKGENLLISITSEFVSYTIEKLLSKKEFQNIEVNTKEFTYEKVNGEIYHYHESKDFKHYGIKKEGTLFIIPKKEFDSKFIHKFMVFSKNVKTLIKRIDDTFNMKISIEQCSSKKFVPDQQIKKKEINIHHRKLKIEGLEKDYEENFTIITQIGHDEKLITDWGFITQLAIQENNKELLFYYYPNPLKSIVNSLSGLLNHGLNTKINEKFKKIEFIEQDLITKLFIQIFTLEKADVLLVSNEDPELDSFMKYLNGIIMVLPKEILIEYSPSEEILMKIIPKINEQIPEKFYYRLIDFFKNSKLISKVPKKTLKGEFIISEQILSYFEEEETDLWEFITTEELSRKLKLKQYNRDIAIEYWLKKHYYELLKNNKIIKDMDKVNEKLKLFKNIPKELNEWHLIETVDGLKKIKEKRSILYSDDETIIQIIDYFMIPRAKEDILVKSNDENMILALMDQDLTKLTNNLKDYLFDYIMKSLKSIDNQVIFYGIPELKLVRYKNDKYLSLKEFDIITTNNLIQNEKLIPSLKVYCVDKYIPMIEKLKKLNIIQSKSDLSVIITKNKSIKLDKDEKLELYKSMNILELLKIEKDIKLFGKNQNLMISQCYNPEIELFKHFFSNFLLDDKYNDPSTFKRLEQKYHFHYKPSFEDIQTIIENNMIKTEKDCYLILDELLEINLNFDHKTLIQNYNIVPITGNKFVKLRECVDTKYYEFVSERGYYNLDSKYCPLLCQKEPTFDEIQKNLDCLIYEYHSKNTRKDLLDKIENIYKYLDQNNQSIGDYVIKNGFRISKRDLFSGLDRDYPPYFYTIRNDEKLMKLQYFISQISDLPSAEKCDQVLKEIQRKYKNKRLTEDIKQLVIECIQILIRNSSPIHYLLSKNEEICKIEDLVTNDDNNIYKSIKKESFNFLHPLLDAFEVTNHVEGLQKLSKLILIEYQGDGKLYHTEFTKSLEKKLNEDKFIQGLCSLILKEKFEIKFGNKKKQEEINEKIIEIKKVLKEIKVREVSDSSVIYFKKLENGHQDVTVDKNSNSLCVFDGETLLIKQNPNESIIYYLICNELNQNCFGGLLQDTTNLWKYFTFGTFDENEFYLEDSNIIGKKINDKDKNALIKLEVNLNEIVEYKGNYAKVLEKQKKGYKIDDGSVKFVTENDINSIFFNNIQKYKVKIIELKNKDKEYIEVENMFQKTMKLSTVIKIEIIDNPILKGSYNQSLKDKSHEKKLFHGTRGTSPKKIIFGENGLDMRFSNNGMWGKGIYFAVNAKYSDDYSHHTKNEKQMFLCLVNVGYFKELKSNGSIKKPPEGYDSIKGNTGGSDVFILYENGKCYPKYLITYQ